MLLRQYNTNTNQACFRSGINCALPLLVEKAADPLRPHPYKVANSIGIFRELSWLTRGDRKAAGLRSARPPKLRIAIDLIVITNKLTCFISHPPKSVIYQPQKPPKIRKIAF